MLQQIHAKAMRILIFVLVVALSTSNGSEFAGDLKADALISAHIVDGRFETRLDHFRPQDIHPVMFVSFLN